MTLGCLPITKRKGTTMTDSPKFNMFKSLATDSDLEKNGKWVEPFGPKEEGFPAFLIARMGGANNKYQRSIQQRLRKYQRMVNAQKDNPSDGTIKLVEEQMKEAFVEGVLLGWENVFDANDVALPFTKENALKVVTKLPQVYETLLGLAQDYSTFREEDIEAAAKN